MLESHRNIATPEGLIVADEVNFQSKIAEFAITGAANVHAIFDFDRTLTIKRPGTEDEVTTWHILREHLPEEGRLAYQRLFEKYRTLELSGNMTQQDAVDWWSSTLNLFVEYRVNLAAVEETFLDRASIRPGTAELFKLLVDNGIPAVILSAGVREVIEIWCRKYEIKPSLIISTALTLDSNSVISGWQKDTLVHILNKSEASHPELLAIRAGRQNALLVGDSLDDAAMATGKDNVVRVRILDPRADEAVNEQEVQKTFERFDALIRTGTLQPLLGFVQLLT